MKRQRDSAEERSRERLCECYDLSNKLRDAAGELYRANERQQNSDNNADAERRESRNTAQKLHDQNLVNEEEICSLKQQASSIECVRDDYRRKFDHALRESRNLVRENQNLKREIQNLDREKQQLNASVAGKEETIQELQARQNDRNPGPVTATSIYIQSNEMELAKRKGSVTYLEQQNERLTSEIEELRTKLEALRDEHGKCSGHLHSQLADKDRKMSTVRLEKKTADDESVKTVASLRVELRAKVQKVEDLEEANGKLVASQSSSAYNAQRLNSELELSQQAHLQCDEKSARQTSRNDELVIEKEQLEEKLRVSNEEIRILQGRVTKSHNDLQELQESHVNAQASEITQLHSLQRSNNDLSLQLVSARNDLANLILEGQRVEERNRSLESLQSRRQGETRSLQAQIQTLSQTVDHQQHRIFSLGTNCPRCQKMREALDAVVKDVEMSDEESRVKMKREVAEELRSQVPDDLRRHIRGEVVGQVREEFQKHYSDILQKNTRRIQEQDRLIVEKDAELVKIKTNPALNHAACEERASNLQLHINKLKQAAKIAQGNFSRLSNDAKNNCAQLSHARRANEDLRRELETIKADQRRAQNINPLQSRLAACQRESEKMKMDRDKARDNCGIYSKNLSDLRRAHEALRNEHTALKEQSSEPRRVDGDEAAALNILRHEIDLREARDGKAKAIHARPRALARPAQGSDNEADNQTPLPTGGVEKSDDECEEGELRKAKPASKPQGRSSQRPAILPAHQPTTKPVLGGVAGKKREREENAEEEADKEGGDDRKKMKIGVDMIEGVRRLQALSRK